MAYTDQTTTPPPPIAAMPRRSVDHHRSRETKGSLKTTELWLTLAGIAALIVAYNVADDSSLDLWRVCLLCVVLGAAYVVSRGVAKSGARDERWDHDDRY